MLLTLTDQTLQGCGLAIAISQLLRLASPNHAVPFYRHNWYVYPEAAKEQAAMKSYDPVLEFPIKAAPEMYRQLLRTIFNMLDEGEGFRFHAQPPHSSMLA